MAWLSMVAIIFGASGNNGPSEGVNAFGFLGGGAGGAQSYDGLRARQKNHLYDRHVAPIESKIYSAHENIAVVQGLIDRLAKLDQTARSFWDVDQSPFIRLNSQIDPPGYFSAKTTRHAEPGTKMVRVVNIAEGDRLQSALDEDEIKQNLPKAEFRIISDDSKIDVSFPGGSIEDLLKAINGVDGSDLVARASLSSRFSGGATFLLSAQKSGEENYLQFEGNLKPLVTLGLLHNIEPDPDNSSFDIYPIPIREEAGKDGGAQGAKKSASEQLESGQDGLDVKAKTTSKDEQKGVAPPYQSLIKDDPEGLFIRLSFGEEFVLALDPPRRIEDRTKILFEFRLDDAKQGALDSFYPSKPKDYMDARAFGVGVTDSLPISRWVVKPESLVPLFQEGKALSRREVPVASLETGSEGVLASCFPVLGKGLSIWNEEALSFVGSNRADQKNRVQGRDKSQRDDSQRDGSQRNDSQRDGSQRNGSQRNDSQRDDSQRNDSQRDGSQRDGSQRDGLLYLRFYNSVPGKEMSFRKIRFAYEKVSQNYTYGGLGQRLLGKNYRKKAQNARVLVDSSSYESASNSIEIDKGVSLDLHKAMISEDLSSTLRLFPKVDRIINKIRIIIDDYNVVAAYIYNATRRVARRSAFEEKRYQDELSRMGNDEKSIHALLGRDVEGKMLGDLALLRIQRLLRSAFVSNYVTEKGNVLSHARQIGIDSPQSTISVVNNHDESRNLLSGWIDLVRPEALKDALSQHARAVRQLFYDDVDEDFIYDRGIAVSISNLARDFSSRYGRNQQKGKSPILGPLYARIERYQSILRNAVNGLETVQLEKAQDRVSRELRTFSKKMGRIQGAQKKLEQFTSRMKMQQKQGR